MKVEIRYSVEITDEKIIEKALKNASDYGYDYGDAGKVETMKRYLTCEGIDNVFPDGEFDRNLVEVKRG